LWLLVTTEARTIPHSQSANILPVMKACGAPAQARFVLDAFRNRDHRIRTVFELNLAELALARLYEAFIGPGVATHSLRGELGVFVKAAWNDTECFAARGRIRSLGTGTLGTPVIRALFEKLPAADSFPGGAAAERNCSGAPVAHNRVERGDPSCIDPPSSSHCFSSR